MYTEKYRTGRKRFWVAIVDGIIFMPLLFVDRWFLNHADKTSLILSWTICSIFLPSLYSILLHYKYGHTIGKWVAGLQVVDLGETKKMTLKQSVLRESFYLIISIAGLSLVFQTGDAGYIFNSYQKFANQAILWWTLIELITMFSNSKRRALHDYIAKSVVVRTNNSAN